MLTVNALGVAAFVAPFFLAGTGPRAETVARAEDAPMLFALFAALLVAVAASGARAGRMDAKRLALLGVLAGVNAVLRLPGALGGGSLMFFLPIVCGATFGPGFGFMLGASSFAASAVLTGGVGPWLPFQMWALGWIGGGAGLLRPLLARAPRPWISVLTLAAYGWIGGLAFGALTNLWFWPFAGGAAEISWQPGIGALEAARRYVSFYLLTSLPWDSSRAVLNVLLMGVLARPCMRLLGRYRARLDVVWSSGTPAPEPALGRGVA